MFARTAISAALLFVLSTDAAFSNEETDAPRDLILAAASALQNGEPPASVLQRKADLEALSRFVLGGYARNLDPDDRQAFEAAFSAYAVSQFERSWSQNTFERLEIKDVIPRRPGDVIVASTLHRQGEDPLQVSWRVVERPTGWRVVDFEAFGIWFGIEQRAQIAARLDRPGTDFADLVDFLKTADTAG